MRRTVLSVATLSVLLTACGVTGSASHDPPPGHAPDAAHAGADLPRGWRWESYRGVQVGVPADWKYGASTGQVTTQWCIDAARARPPEPLVARPGPHTLALCAHSSSRPRPGTLIENTGVFLAFDDSSGARPPAHEGDRRTVQVRGVRVLVQAEPALRRRIVDTIHTVDVDTNGCPAAHRISDDPVSRPDPPVEVAALSGVSAVAACKYAVTEVPRPRATLLSSLRLTGSAAAALVGDIAAAPVGGGPDTPGSCLPSDSYGDDAIVLRITSDRGTSEVYVRYSGCDHNGFDDGTRVRALTADSMAPVTAGPNQVLSYVGGAKKSTILSPKQDVDPE